MNKRILAIMGITKIWLLFLFLVCSFTGFSQVKNRKTLDSLLYQLPKINNNKSKVDVLCRIGAFYLEQGLRSSKDSAIYYSQKASEIALKTNYIKGLAEAKFNFGKYNITVTRKYAEATPYLLESLSLFEDISDSVGISKCYLQIGLTSYILEYYEDAIKNFKLSILNDENGVAKYLIALSFLELENFPNSKSYFAQAIKDFSESKNTSMLNGSYIFLGKLNLKMLQTDSAFYFLRKAINNYVLFKDSISLVRPYAFISSAYLQKNQIDSAIYFANRSLSYVSIVNDDISSIEATTTLSKAYAIKGDYKNAYYYLKMLNDLQGRFAKGSTKQRVADMQSKFDFEKRMHDEQFKQLKDKQIAEHILSNEKMLRNSFIIGSILLLLLLLALNNRYKFKKRANITLESRNREITKSIEYALRIQTAILPSQKIVKQYLENAFILYKPKDIVAGDFYWIESVGEIVLFAACDCTGHGVPGAMVSVVCHNALNRAVREFGLTQPAAILDKTAEIVIEIFSKSEEDIKDGMDISLCAYNKKEDTFQWAGANNPLWIFQNAKLIETKADKQPVGKNENNLPFTNHTFTLSSGDTLYLFTDGFADQFGGEKGQKKLTRRRFRDLIISFQNKTMQEQEMALDKFYKEYKGEVEQIDDILVMGVKV